MLKGSALGGVLSMAALIGVLGACKESEEGEDAEDGVEPVTVPAADAGYIVVAWNDLGMHCLNPTYDTAVILPPYNNVWAQVIRRADQPEIVTEGVTVTYAIVDNTFSAGKTDALGGDFAQFWTNAEALFGASDLVVDTGLNLVDPTVHNGLEGTMVASLDHFQVDGIPIVPVSDDGTWDPYQIGEIKVADVGGAVVASTRIAVPTSDEINCTKCHGPGGVANDDLGGGTANAFENVLALHDGANGTQLLEERPVLCASCHASPALGQLTRIGEMPYLSEAVHGAHAELGATCYDCHPGERTRCSRSLAHRGADDQGNCVSCHGTLTDVADSIAEGDRVPWVDEPRCVTCHEGVAEVDTGDTLYRHARGHGAVYCAACHGSPHAQVPSAMTTDNAQSLDLQGAAKALGSCGACHGHSRGAGAAEFAETHGGARSHTSACQVCHTSVTGGTAAWPHQFQWQAR